MVDKSQWSLFVGFGSCAVGGIILYCYKQSNQYLKVLQGLEEYNVDNDLYENVKSSGGILPYVAVNGNVVADDKHVPSVHSEEGVEGVIRNIKIKEHRSKWNSATKSWYDTKRTISSSWKTEPFSLTNTAKVDGCSNNIKVSVKDPRSAHTLNLSKTADSYEPIESSAGLRVMDYVAGERVKGIQTVEKMLVVNSTLTVIGEVQLSPDSGLTISAPSNDNLRYYITNSGLHGVISEERGLRTTLKVLSIIFFVIGGGFGLYWLRRRYKKYVEHKQHLRAHQEMKDFNDKSDVDNHVCSICLDEPRDIVFLPCGHICVCSKCSEMVEKCPVCRGRIDSKSVVFYS